MRKWLATHKRLIRIAHDLGYEGSSPMEAIDFIMEQARGYRWTLDDLRARWGNG